MYLDYLIRSCDYLQKAEWMCQACNCDNYCFNDCFPQTSCTWTYNCKGYDTQADKYVPWTGYWENSNHQTIPNVACNFYCDKYICNASPVNLLMEVSMVGYSIETDYDCQTCPVFVHSTFLMCGGACARINTLDWARTLGRIRYTGICNTSNIWSNYNCPTDNGWWYSCYNLPYRIHVTARPLTGFTDRSACCCGNESDGHFQWDCRPLGSQTALTGLDCSPTPSQTPNSNASLPIITTCCYLNSDYLNNKYGVRAAKTYTCTAMLYKIGQTMSGVDKYVSFSSCGDEEPDFNNRAMRQLFTTGNIAIMMGNIQWSPLFYPWARGGVIDPSDACNASCWPSNLSNQFTGYPIAWSVSNKCFKVPIGTNVSCCNYVPTPEINWRVWRGKACISNENGQTKIQLPLGYSVDVTCHQAPVGSSWYELPYYSYNGDMI